MAHIRLPEGLQGIRAAMAFRPETAGPLNQLAEILLHAPNSLAPGERELIATYVSSLNDCYFCQTVHGAIAAAHLNDDEELVRRVKADFQHAGISEKLKALQSLRENSDLQLQPRRGDLKVAQDASPGNRSQPWLVPDPDFLPRIAGRGPRVRLSVRKGA
jgi:AhpD family alkylhydroperoxidase